MVPDLKILLTSSGSSSTADSAVSSGCGYEAAADSCGVARGAIRLTIASQSSSSSASSSIFSFRARGREPPARPSAARERQRLTDGGALLLRRDRVGARNLRPVGRLGLPRVGGDLVVCSLARRHSPLLCLLDLLLALERLLRGDLVRLAARLGFVSLQDRRLQDRPVAVQRGRVVVARVEQRGANSVPSLPVPLSSAIGSCQEPSALTPW